MSRKNKAVKELKRRLIEEPEFKVAAEYFFDVVARLPGMRVSETAQHPRVQQAVATSVSEVLDKNVDASHVLVGRLSGTELLHGMAHVGGALCAFFYFEADDVGLVMVSPFVHDEATAFIRLSLFELPAYFRAAPGSSTPS